MEGDTTISTKNIVRIALALKYAFPHFIRNIENVKKNTKRICYSQYSLTISVEIHYSTNAQDILFCSFFRFCECHIQCTTF